MERNHPPDRTLLLALDTAIVLVALVLLYCVALLLLHHFDQPDQPTVITRDVGSTDTTERAPITVCRGAFSC